MRSPWTDVTRHVKSGAVFTMPLVWLLTMWQSGHAQGRDSIPPVTVGGFVDSYFSWNTARPPSHVNRLRNFDITEDEFVLSEAQVDVQRIPAPIGFHVAFNTGSASDVIHAGSTSTLNLLMQGYITLVAPVGAGLTVDAGKFVTHMGFETINAKDNFNYSRSFLFAWAIPYYHVGLRAAYPVSEKLTIGASVSNGWNAVASQNGKTFGATATLAPSAALALTVNWIGGPGLPDSAASDFRNIGEVIASLQIAEQLTVAADLLYGTDNLPAQRALWKGAALYGKYAFSGNSSVSTRLEVYDDAQGYTTGFVQTLSEITLTYEYKILQNLLIRGEYRHDRSSADAFDGHAGIDSRDQQNTLAVGCIVTF